MATLLFKSECMQPINLKKQEVTVPCGKCPNCLARRVSGWSFRLSQESKLAESAWFITLTYDTKFVPITQNGFLSLCKRDVQLFVKRLRKAHGAGHRRLVYYVCGEYGGKTGRPHYHMILFNARLELIQPAWQNGDIHYGEVNAASCGYTLKYMTKGRVVPKHCNDDRVPEFSLMSKGIGANYLTSAMCEWHKADVAERVYCALPDGKKAPMCRYYKDKLYTKEERERIVRVHDCKRTFAEESEFEREKHLPVKKLIEERNAASELKKYKFAKMANDSKRNKI